MTEAHSISEALVPLISRNEIPLKTITIIGEIITVDAALRHYDQGTTKRTTGEELGVLLESYDAVLQRTLSAVAEFLKAARDRETLVKRIPEIKAALTALL